MSAFKCPYAPHGRDRCPEWRCDCFIDTHPDDPFGLHPEDFTVVGTREDHAMTTLSGVLAEHEDCGLYSEFGGDTHYICWCDRTKRPGTHRAHVAAEVAAWLTAHLEPLIEEHAAIAEDAEHGMKYAAETDNGIGLAVEQQRKYAARNTEWRIRAALAAVTEEER